MSTEEIRTVTCYGCPHAVCFVQAHLVDGELVAVTPDPGKPCVDRTGDEAPRDLAFLRG